MAFALLIAVVVGALLFPERFILFNASFVDYTDSMLSYAGAFYVTNSLLHGGIQLWDRFDQMPLTFFQLNFAMYKFSNVLTALLYAPLSLFSKEPAHLFHSLFSAVFIYSALCVRIVSVYLLLSLFVRQRWILIFATVYGAAVLVPQFMMGVSTNIIYSLFPLMMYSLLRFIDALEFDHLILFVAIWAYCVATDLFCGLGYLYQALHFIVLPSMVWAGWRHKGKLNDVLKRWTKAHTKKTVLVVVLAALMIAPTVYLIKTNYHDYEFGMDNSRMKNPFSVSAYFTRPAAWAPQNDFLKRSLDFTENLWALSWMYIGAGAIFFTLLGFFAMKDSRKWILGAALLLFFFINSPRDAGGLSALAHWINALTNPLKFLPRSFHMSCALLLPFVILPLAAAGFSWFWERFIEQKKEGQQNDFPLRLAAWLFLIIGICVYASLPLAAKNHLLICTGAIVFIWVIRTWVHGRMGRIIAVMALALLFAADGWGMSRYVRGLLDTVLTTPRRVLTRGDVGLVNLDYQNPRILPVREYYALSLHKQEDTYLFSSGANMPGLVFRYTNHLRYYQPISNYLPRHAAFSKWVDDKGAMLYYLQQDPRMMFLASTAVNNGGDNFQTVLARGLARSVAVIEGNKNLPDIVPDLPALDPTVNELKQISIPWSEVNFKRQGNFKIGSFAMPKDLARYYASTFLTPDERLFHLEHNGAAFKTAQGNLVVPMAFDVNNARDGWVSFAVLKDFSASGEGLTFAYPIRPKTGMTDVVTNTMDDFGFVYTADRDGWLIVHQPFDTKWKVYLDGKKTDFYKANKSFIGIPIAQGQHTVLLRYWPHTPVRFLLGISIIVSVLFLFWILKSAVRSLVK